VGSNGLIQSAADNAARFDHDPTSPFACRGLLIEESRTNLLTQSETWSSGASFTGPSTPTVTPNTTNAPNGALTADTLTGSTGTATDGSVNSTWRLPAVSSSTAYTFSIYVRSLGVATKAEIRIRDNSTGASTQTLDTALTANWKRISVTHTTGATTSSIRCIIQNTDGPIAIWGAQIEAGSFATSYIPTTTASVVRSADVCSITGANFTSITGSVGSPFSASVNFIADLSRLTAIAGSPLSFNTSNNNGIFLYKFNNSASFGVYHVSTNAIIGTLAAGLGKAAMAYDGDSVVGVLNNGTVSAEQGNSALAFTEMIIGSTRSGGNNFGGPISSVRVYRKRLPNAKLVQLTV
jgi:hypothetical protein